MILLGFLRFHHQFMSNTLPREWGEYGALRALPLYETRPYGGPGLRRWNREAFADTHPPDEDARELRRLNQERFDRDFPKMHRPARVG